MKLVGQSFEILAPKEGMVAKYEIYSSIVESARVSYRSEDFDSQVPKSQMPETIDKMGKFIRLRISEGHESVLEHAYMRIRFTTNRAIANELTRHRMMAWTQESTRYCNYAKDKFGGEVQFVYSPYFGVGTAGFDSFVQSCEKAEKEYFALLNIRYSPAGDEDYSGRNGEPPGMETYFLTPGKRGDRTRASHDETADGTRSCAGKQTSA